MQTQEERRLLGIILEDLGHSDRSYFDALSDHEKSIVIRMLSEVRETSAAIPTLSALWELDYVRKPVDVMTFLTDPQYLGMHIVSSLEDENKGGGIFQTWADTMQELFRPDKVYWELILSSSIGTGKTSCAVLALVYKLYRLSCLRDPQKFYGMLPGHAIVFGIYNIFKYKAQSVATSYLRAAIEGSPYFNEVFPLNKKKTSEIELPNAIKINIGSTGLHAIGENIFSVLIDETEFMKAVAAGQATEDDKGQAWNLYNSTLRRIESRFGRFGEIPGLMIQISSKGSADSYLAERIKSRGDARDVLIIEKTSWEVKPWRYGGKTFPLFIGDNYTDPRILDAVELEKMPDKSNVMQVPEEHRMAFDEDMHGALRDLANVASGAVAPLIPRRDRIHSAIDDTRVHPFTKVEFHIGFEDSECIEDFLDLDSLLRTVQSRFVPRVRPTVGRYIHLDLAVSGDALGFAMGHVADFDIIKKKDVNADGHEHEIRLPRIYIDLILRVIPAKGSKIRLSAVRDFIIALRAYGYSITKVSGDTYQSTDLLQQLARSGIPTEVLSVDVAKEKSGHPYAFLREAIMEERISYYKHDQFLVEAANLQRFDVAVGGRIKWKVDHPQKMRNLDGVPIKGGKDCADAVAGVAYHCMMQEPDVDPPSISPAQAIINASPKHPESRFLTNDSWAIGSDYQP